VKYFSISILALLLVAELLATGCYFFRKKKAGGSGSNAVMSTVVTGPRASAVNRTLLDEIHAVRTEHAPAAIRPDPDVFVRRLLLEYRKEGATVARQIGLVENYRLLLGGASDDFITSPQEGYDATSLLAKLKVGELICEGLVDPSGGAHGNWTSILPHDVAEREANIRFLIQRLTGLPSPDIPEEKFASLLNILESQVSMEGKLDFSSYVVVCATLIIDSESLLF